jgi:murein DD-endopeptidase MepM/ murein hydrolase activator NlpD
MRRTVLAGAWALLSAGLLGGACAAPAEPSRSGPAPSDIVLPVDSRIVSAAVPPNATLETLLRADGLTPDRVLALIDATRPVFDPRRLRAHQPYRLVVGLDGALRTFEYQIDDSQYLQVVGRDGPGAPALDARIVAYDLKTALVAVRAEIDADHPSIIAALEEAGEGVPLAVEVAQVLSGEVDFNTDLRVGDRLDVLFEQKLREGRPSGYGPVVAAALDNDGRVVRAFRFVDPDGRADYYDAEGRSLRRMFLSSPLPFEPRITSGFSRHRFHPIYKIFRPHLGVDYAAPIGTSVVAVANGVVESAGFSGESGRMVRLRHADGYETYYLHLSAIAKGIHPGARVEQGQLVGRVGMTGAATGPHLDFRVRQRGGFINPLTLRRNLPPGKPIAPAYLAAFQLAKARIEWQLAMPAATGVTANGQ